MHAVRCIFEYLTIQLLVLPGRVFGSKFAEMPFVATKAGYRREGNCKRLLKVPSLLLIVDNSCESVVTCVCPLHSTRTTCSIPPSFKAESKSVSGPLQWVVLAVHYATCHDPSPIPDDVID